MTHRLAVARTQGEIGIDGICKQPAVTVPPRTAVTPTRRYERIRFPYSVPTRQSYPLQ